MLFLLSFVVFGLLVFALFIPIMILPGPYARIYLVLVVVGVVLYSKWRERKDPQRQEQERRRGMRRVRRAAKDLEEVAGVRVWVREDGPETVTAFWGHSDKAIVGPTDPLTVARRLERLKSGLEPDVSEPHGMPW